MKETFGLAICVPGRKLLPNGSPPPVMVSRVNAAVEIWKMRQDDVPLLVFSGGKMPLDKDEVARAGITHSNNTAVNIEVGNLEKRRQYISEAECMANLAVSQGVPIENILLEEEALHTIENVINIKRLLDSRSFKEFLLDFHPVEDMHVLTKEEIDRENVVEPAMIERLPYHLFIYKEWLKGKSNLVETRKLFFQADYPHSSVFKLDYPSDFENQSE